MNDTQTHFVAVCPHCSTALRIRRVFAGQQVQCKHCKEKFEARDTEPPGTVSPVEAAAPPAPTPPQGERIVVTCPTCQTTLSVRRVYIGRRVRCKECDESFLVSDSPASDLPSRVEPSDRPETDTGREALQAELDRLSSENQRLRADHDRIQAEHKQTSSESQQLREALDQVRAEHDRLLHELDHATTVLESIRADLGGLAPAEVGPLVRERSQLTAEADILKRDMQVLSLEVSAMEQTRIAMENEGSFVKKELDRLSELLKEQEAELKEARAEQDRLGIDRQQARDETEQLRAVLADREQVVRGEGDQLRSEIESLRRDLADAEQAPREEVARLEAQLAGLAEEHRRLQEQLEATDPSCQQPPERVPELPADLDQLPTPTPAPASNDELQDARAEIESLTRKLATAERIQGEMASMLAGMGIRFREV